MEKLESWGNLGLLPQKLVTVIEKVWERPIIQGRNDYLVGFIDMKVICNVPELGYSGNYSPKWDVYDHRHSLFFEAKTSIKSIGEVIRQIQTYKTYCKQGKYIIVSPDDRYAELLKEQNIGFLKCACELPKAKGQLDFFTS